MSRFLSIVILTFALLVPAAAQNSPVASTPASVIVLGQAVYRFNEVRLEGNVSLLTDEQKNVIAAAVRQELPAALARRYPDARLATEQDVPSVVVTPVVVVPAALTLFESIEVRLELSVEGQATPLVASQRFGLALLWSAQETAHRVALDAVFAALP